jgi:molecular chaperone GrpE
MFGKRTEKTTVDIMDKREIIGEESEAETTAEDMELQEEPIDEMEQIKMEAAENYEKYLRISAEFENYKKRVQKDRTDLLNYGNERLIKDLLPAVDSIERALEHAPNSGDVDAFAEGLKLINEKLLASLEKHGVERIDSIGKEFDPNFHEAIFQVERNDLENNKVVEEFEKGYLLNGRLLRPSKVSISRRSAKGKKKK